MTQSYMQNNLYFHYYLDTFNMLFCSQMERVGHRRNWLTCNKIETALGKKLTFHSFEFIKRTVSFYNALKVHLNGSLEINSLVQEIEKGQNDFGIFCIAFMHVKFSTK